jgi:O-antigen ligase
MRAHRTRAGRPSARQRRRLVPSPGPRWHALVSLVSRLVVAEAGACAAIGVGYNRRHLPWLLLTVAVAVALCGLAALVRSGTHTAWLAAITVESGLVAVGLFRFAYARYLGGTLLAIITLGTLLRPAVSRAFSAGRDRAELTVGQHSLAESAAELQGSAASP